MFTARYGLGLEMLLRLNSVFKMVMEHLLNIHQCSILILIYMLLLSEGETREARKPSREQWNTNQKSTFAFVSPQGTDSPSRHRGRTKAGYSRTN